MGRRQVPYPPEYREGVVRLVRDDGKSIGQVAKDLGIADRSLRNWVKQSDLDAGRRDEGLTTEERAALRRRPPRTSGAIATLLQRLIWYGGNSRRRRRTACGSRTSRTCGPTPGGSTPGGCTWPSCWMCSAAEWWVGQ
jgi:transposase